MEKKTLAHGQMACSDCDGTGQVECENCGGSGTTMTECNIGYEHEIDCDECDCGYFECSECDGTGGVPDPIYVLDEGI